MAMSARRTAQRFAQLVEAATGTPIPDSVLPQIEPLFAAMIEEIKQHMEAQNLNVPATGLTYQDDDGTSVTEKSVEGTSTTGTIPSGNFR